MEVNIRKFLGYRGWKVWMSYDMHISLLALFYILIADNLFRPLDSLVLISSLGFYFMYGFLINDFFDMPYDIAAGKRRVIQELSRFKFIITLLCVIFICAIHLLYLKEIPFVIIYITAYILATLYSAPPVRFKSRSLSGIIVNGLIEKMLPVLAIFTFFNHFGIDTLLFLAASFSIGIVEIITHQIYDYESDLKTENNTFAVSMEIDKTLSIFKNFISPFSGVLLLFFCLFLIVKVPYANLIAISVFISYGIVFLLISKGKFSRQETIFPLYMSGLFLLIHNAFPTFLALILVLKSHSNIALLLISAGSQYYILKYRLKAIKEKFMPHTEIFVDTGKEK